MKISLNWASHWTQVPDYSPDALEKFSHTYSTYTAEVEGIDSYVYDDKIVVAKVLSWKPHPDSDKLGLAQVDAGKCGQHEIVCGAGNAKTSKYVPVALENAKIGDIVIARRAIRGIDSCGMICSLDELGLQADRAEGIFPLETVWDEKALEKHLGKPFGNLTLSFPGRDGDIEYAMNDVVFDLDNKFITNRPDLFSVIGNAREIACINRTPFLKGKSEGISLGVKGDLLGINPQSSSSTSSESDSSFKKELSVKVESDKVINYILTEYTLPSLPASPFLIQTLLRRSNQGSHGLLPDLTNIVMTELGQPMHVFDADTIKGNITLRMAKKGEKFSGLDGKEYSLDSSDLVIVDDKEVLALAGIMGGKNSGVMENTRHIFVESATFDPICVRKTSQRLGIRTDSSLRFEKGVDRTLPHLANARYAELLQYFIPDVKIGKSSVITTPHTSTTLEISHEMIERKIGTPVTEKNITDILTRLGFAVTFNAKHLTYNVIVPSWRDTGDISIPEDIVEEIARHIGYETIPSEPLPGPLGVAHVNAHDILTNMISGFFADRGYFDAYTYPFTLEERYSRFSDAKPAVIHNTTENRTHLRAHLAENLLELVANNYRSHTDGAFFEFGAIFDGEEKLQGLGVLWGKNADKLQEHLTSYMMTFFGNPGMLAQGTGDTKLFAPKAYGEIFISKSKEQRAKYSTSSYPEALEGSKEEDFSIDEVAVRFGLVKPTLLPLFDIDGIDVYAFEIVKLPTIHRPITFTQIPEFPGTRRELNFIMPEETPVAVVTSLVRSSHELVSDIGVTEIYRDAKHIGADKKSVIVSFLIRNTIATITDEEAGTVQLAVVEKLATAGYTLRGV